VSCSADAFLAAHRTHAQHVADTTWQQTDLYRDREGNPRTVVSGWPLADADYIATITPNWRGTRAPHPEAHVE
jgi:hypothetical protein